MQPSTFRPILEHLVQGLEGAQVAVFIDYEGEAIDYVGQSEDDTETLLFGAHWQIIHHHLRRSFDKLNLPTPFQEIYRHSDVDVVLTPVGKEYLLVLAVAAEKDLIRAMERSRRAVIRLRREMGI